MRKFKIILFLSFLIPFVTRAEIHLDSPQDLLKTAQKSVTDLRDVILDMQQNIPEMRDPDTFEKYFFILDDLQALATKMNLDNYYPRAIEKLAVNMVNNGIRWLDFRKKVIPKLDYYIKWMDPDALIRLEELEDYQLSVAKTKEELDCIGRNVHVVIATMKTLKNQPPPYVQQGFSLVEANSSLKMLKLQVLTPTQEEAVILRMANASVLGSYIEYLSSQIYQTKKANRSQLHAHLSRLITVSKTVPHVEDTTAPTSLINAYQDLAVETIFRMMNFEEPFRSGEIERVFAIFDARHIQSIVSQWMSEERIPKGQNVQAYLQATSELLKRAENYGLDSESQMLKKWISKIVVPLYVRQMNLEGQYNLVDESGVSWSFTLILAKENLVVAALSNGDATIFKNFYYVSFDHKKKQFVAMEREPDFDPEVNPYISFTTDKENNLIVTDLLARDEAHKLVGKKSQSFAKINEPSMNEKRSQIKSGVFEGEIILPSGEKRNAKLFLDFVNGSAVGRLQMNEIALQLTIGSSGRAGILKLTSVRAHGASWIHLRLVQNEDELHGFVIVGGKGQAPEPTIFKRIK